MEGTAFYTEDVGTFFHRGCRRPLKVERYMIYLKFPLIPSVPSVYPPCPPCNRRSLFFPVWAVGGGEGRENGAAACERGRGRKDVDWTLRVS